MADRSSFRAWVESLTALSLSEKLSMIQDDIAEGDFHHTGAGQWTLGTDEYTTDADAQQSTAYLYGRYRRACRKHDEEPGPFEAAEED